MQPFALGNLISGGNNTGIYIYNTGGNVVQGNYIGLNAAGASALGNNNNGIMINGGGGNLVGGPGNARNFISGNGISGVFLNGASAGLNVISNNFIGTDNSGEMAVSNVNDGITVSGAPSNTISGNVISGNGTNGVYLAGAGAVGNTLAGNFIGTDAAGMLALGNHSDGVAISAGSGNLVGAGNVISGNFASGLFHGRRRQRESCPGQCHRAFRRRHQRAAQWFQRHFHQRRFVKHRRRRGLHRAQSDFRQHQQWHRDFAWSRMSRTRLLEIISARM